MFTVLSVTSIGLLVGISKRQAKKIGGKLQTTGEI
jgi:hypothetical protein